MVHSKNATQVAFSPPELVNYSFLKARLQSWFLKAEINTTRQKIGEFELRDHPFLSPCLRGSSGAGAPPSSDLFHPPPLPCKSYLLSLLGCFSNTKVSRLRSYWRDLFREIYEFIDKTYENNICINRYKRNNKCCCLLSTRSIAKLFSAV